MEKFVTFVIVGWFVGLLIANVFFQMLWNYYTERFALVNFQNLGFWEAYGLLILVYMLFGDKSLKANSK